MIPLKSASNSVLIYGDFREQFKIQIKFPAMVIGNGGIMILACTSRKKWNMFSKFLDLVQK